MISAEFADTLTTHANGNISRADEESTPPSATENGTTGNVDIELIFLGTGTSSSVPNLGCLTAPPSKEHCRTCHSTLRPEGKKNIRRNTSAVVRVNGGKNRKTTTLVIDVGKNFQAAAVEWFPKYGLREIDAVLITHAHADAINGLDDLRGEYRFLALERWTLGSAIQEHIDVYVSQGTFREIQRAFPYLVAKEYASGGGDVPDFEWHIIEDKIPFEIKDTGIWVTPFSVHHGRLFTTSPPAMFDVTRIATKPPTPTLGGSSASGGAADDKTSGTIRPYLCFGFLVQDAIVYMSDVSLIPDEAWKVIESGGRKSVLVIDCLRLRRHTSHMGVLEAAEAMRRIGARRSYMTGFSHDVAQEEWVKIGESVGAGLDGDLSETELKGIELMREGLAGEVRWVRPAHDGLRVLLGPGGCVWDETYT